MTVRTRLAAKYVPEKIQFSSAGGYMIRADFTGGEISSDLSVLLLSAVDRRIGLIDRLTTAIPDFRHPSYIKHTLHDLLTQRIFQIASGYEDGNDSNTLRRAPLVQAGSGTRASGYR